MANALTNFKVRFKLTYGDSRNMIHFSIFSIQIFPSSQKITIPKYNTVSYSETEKQNFLSAAVKNHFDMHVSCFMRTALMLLHVH